MKLLTLGAALSFTAAASHATIAVTGVPAESLLHSAEGSSVPLTLGVTALLAVSGLYALAVSGRIRPLPLMQNAIYAITGFYLVRGLFLLPQLLGYNIFSDSYAVSSSDLLLSVSALAIGAIHLIGINTQGGSGIH